MRTLTVMPPATKGATTDIEVVVQRGRRNSSGMVSYEIGIKDADSLAWTGWARTDLHEFSKISFPEIQEALQLLGVKVGDTVCFLLDFYPYDYIADNRGYVRRGYGSAALGAIVSDAAASRANVIALESGSKEASIFYERNKFKRVKGGWLPIYMLRLDQGRPSKTEQALRMRRR